MKTRLERRIGRQRKDKESQMDKRRKTEKRMHKGRSARERAEEKTAPGSHNANTLQSIAAKGGIS